MHACVHCPCMFCVSGVSLDTVCVLYMSLASTHLKN